MAEIERRKKKRRVLICIRNQSRSSINPARMPVRKWAYYRGYSYQYQFRGLALIFILSSLWKDNRCLAIPGFSITVPKEVPAQRGLCVYIPCAFTVPDNFKLSAYAKGIWIKGSSSTDKAVAFKSDVETSTGWRYQLTGDVAKGDCSFSINDVNGRDESKYLFRIEDIDIQYTYLETQPYIRVRDVLCEPQSPYHLIAPKTVTAQMGLCVHIPCTFTVPADIRLSTNAQGFWYKTSIISQVNLVASKTGSGANARRRFLLTGDVSKGDCSLSINDVQASDESWYQFRIEDRLTKFTYERTQTYVKVTDITEKPVIVPVTSMKTDEEVTLTCVTPGRCAGSAPTIIWNGIGGLDDLRTLNNKVDYEDGNATYFSHLKFTISRKHNMSSITCTVIYGSTNSAITTSNSLNVEYFQRSHPVSNASSYDVLEPQDNSIDCVCLEFLPILVCIVAGNVLILLLTGLGLFWYVKRIKASAGKGIGSDGQKTEMNESNYQDLEFRSHDIYQTMNRQESKRIATGRTGFSK